MCTTTRRQFTGRMLTVAGAALLGRTILEASALAQAATLSGGELFSRMKWLNEPASATIAADKLMVRSRPKTDFWRKTLTGNVVLTRGKDVATGDKLVVDLRTGRAKIDQAPGKPIRVTISPETQSAAQPGDAITGKELPGQ